MSSISGKKKARQGYVYNTFGDEQYLRYAVASVQTLRRYDRERPVALICDQKHHETLENSALLSHFTEVLILPDDQASITGFKHHLFQFMPFEQNLFLDSDIVWCKNPDPLWEAFTPYKFTITGNQIADQFFGGPKGLGIIADFVFRRRNRTLKRFGLTYLNRVQSGMIYATDSGLTREICDLANEILDSRDQTHFRSRIEEKGREHETCEWSLAMAMAKKKLPVYPWLNGHQSLQLDFLEDYTTYDEEFEKVECLLYSDRFVYDLKAIRLKWFRKLFISFMSLLPGKGDYLYTTPFCLHFGWYHEKEPFRKFSNRIWEKLKS
jgi:hypothetical protein